MLSHNLAPRHELDSLVVNIELTLISIVQGVALTFLAESARPIVAEGKLWVIPYALVSMLVILSVWSRTVMHSFTVIRWPLELGHNFFYIILAAFEAMLFSSMASPGQWFPMSFLLTLVLFAMFLYERRLYRFNRVLDRDSRMLITRLARDHRLGYRIIVPFSIVLTGLMAFAVVKYPETFIEHGWHVALVWLQVAGVAAYLAYSWRFYRTLGEAIVAARREA
jgi:hypothetical protein